MLHLYFSPFTSHCPHCHHHTLRIKDYRDQTVLLGHWNVHPIFAHIHKRRYMCPCCHKTFYEQIPGISRYQRRSNDSIHCILQSCFELMSFSTIARMNHVSVSTVIRYFDRLMVKRPVHLPAILSLDEFRGNAHGSGIRSPSIIRKPTKFLIFCQREPLLKFFCILAAFRGMNE